MYWASRHSSVRLLKNKINPIVPNQRSSHHVNVWLLELSHGAPSSVEKSSQHVNVWLLEMLNSSKRTLCGQATIKRVATKKLVFSVMVLGMFKPLC